MKRLYTSVYLVAIIAVFAVAAELGARVDDWVLFGEGVWASPSFNRNMVIRGRGKPNGRYKRWTLNNFGFRGPDISLCPSPAMTRVFVLGASETFGVNESDNMEFPAQLGTLLGKDGTYEVINGALPGMGLSGMVSYWENWASQFRPDLVVIHPNALFYLTDSPPRRPGANSVAAKASPKPAVESRFLSRFREILRLPRWVQEWRLDRKIAERRAGRPREWYFRSVPEERLTLFLADLATLTDAIRQSGAKPIVLTEAIGATSTDRPDHLAHLRRWLVNVPQADELITLQFTQEANRRIVEFANQRDLAVFDVAARLAGDRDGFADLAHFTDHGAQVVATLVAEGIRRLENGQVGQRQRID